MSNLSLSKRALTGKQKEFVCQYFLNHRDEVKAALAAGYSKGRAAVTACELMQHPAIKREIAKGERRLAKKYGAQMSEAMRQLYFAVVRDGKMMVDEKGNLLPVHLMPDAVTACIDGIKQEVTFRKNGDPVVKTEVKLVSKGSAIDMALKVRGDYAPVKSESKNLNLNLDALYGMPEGALDPDNCEVEEENPFIIDGRPEPLNE